MKFFHIIMSLLNHIRNIIRYVYDVGGMLLLPFIMLAEYAVSHSQGTHQIRLITMLIIYIITFIILLTQNLKIKSNIKLVIDSIILFITTIVAFAVWNFDDKSALPYMGLINFFMGIYFLINALVNTMYNKLLKHKRKKHINS